ncbi:hypothetical protein CBL_02273 [Carabus blaptoides fortunei]
MFSDENEGSLSARKRYLISGNVQDEYFIPTLALSRPEVVTGNPGLPTVSDTPFSTFALTLYSPGIDPEACSEMVSYTRKNGKMKNFTWQLIENMKDFPAIRWVK